MLGPRPPHALPGAERDHPTVSTDEAAEASLRFGALSPPAIRSQSSH